MARVQKSVEEQLAEVKAKRQKLEVRTKQLTDRQRALDLRKRAKGEKALLQLALTRIAANPEFKTALLDQLASAALNAQDRDAVLWLLDQNGALTAFDAKRRPANAA